MVRAEKLTVSAGVAVQVGTPARRALNAEGIAALAAALAPTPGIIEAHLPQVFVPGVTEKPTQALVLVFARGTSMDAIVAALGPRVAAVMPPGVFLDVWPMEPGHPLLPAVRGAGCRVYVAPAGRPWWKFWA